MFLKGRYICIFFSLISQFSWATGKEDSISYLTAIPIDLPEVVDCISKTFSEKEPLSKALLLKSEELESFVSSVSSRSIKNGLTFIARNRQNQLVGCLLCEDFMAPPFDEANQFHPKLAPIWALLDELDNSFKSSNSFKQGQIIHFLMVGAYKEYSKFSIGLNLIKFAESSAKEKQFQGVIAEATGPVSQHIFKKIGYDTLMKIEYSRYTYLDNPIFSNIQDCSSCDLVYKNIQIESR